MAGEPPPLVEQLGLEVDDAISYDTAVKIANTLPPHRLNKPDWCDVSVREVKLTNLQDPPQGNGCTLTHLVDISLDTGDMYQDGESSRGCLACCRRRCRSQPTTPSTCAFCPVAQGATLIF